MNWTEVYLLADMEAEEMMRAEMTDSEMLALILALLPDTYSESKDWRTGNVTERIICLKAWLESKTEEVDRFIDILNDNRTEAQAAEIERLNTQCEGLFQAAMNNGQALIIAESKLAKALKELEWQASQPEAHPFMAQHARTTLAELTGGKP